jgi:hypothetical protein
MPLSAEEYDKLTTEEREAYDAKEREREKEEQAGRLTLFAVFSSANPPIALPYKWIQSLGDVDIVVPVTKGTRGRDLAVSITKKKLSVGLKGQEPIMAGDLCQDIKVDESTWTLGTHRTCGNHILSRLNVGDHRIEDQQEVQIHLEKVNTQQWWANVLTHHPKLDTTKIQPENSKLSDLDGETRRVASTQM